MYNLVEGIVNKLSLNDIFNFASKNSVNLSLDEGEFILRFLKNNWYSLLKNQNIEVIDKDAILQYLQQHSQPDKRIQ